jgi:hypothetical protein
MKLDMEIIFLKIIQYLHHFYTIINTGMSPLKTSEVE